MATTPCQEHVKRAIDHAAARGQNTLATTDIDENTTVLGRKEIIGVLSSNNG
jgi:nitrogenase molybdenum-iron protein alpha/beta subunit